MGVREKLIEWLVRGGDAADAGVAGVSARFALDVVDGDEGWYRQASGVFRWERPWTERRALLDASLRLWRENSFAKRLLKLTRDYCLGDDGITVRSEIASVDRFVQDFWRLNGMSRRMRTISDEFVRSGEVFVTLHRGDDGMSEVRFVPALLISRVDVSDDDPELRTRYRQIVSGGERWWQDGVSAGVDVDYVMLQYAIETPPGIVRGEADLFAIQEWLEAYKRWLQDRVRVNRLKSAFMWHVAIEGASASDISRKSAQYSRPPATGSIVVTDGKERWEAVQPHIEAGDAADDGKALRLAIANAGGIPLHFMSEGESATRATAAEMGEPTFKHFRDRQDVLVDVATSLVETAYRRSRRRYYSDLKLRVDRPRIGRFDAESMGRSARMIIEALGSMRERGWISDDQASLLGFRALEGVLDRDELKEFYHGGYEDEREID